MSISPAADLVGCSGTGGYRRARMVVMTSRRNWWAAGVLAATGAACAGVEWITWKASREFLPPGATDAGRVVAGERVLVLGCPFPVLQRWRVRIAVRSTDPQCARFVFSGGAVRTPVSEAAMMADYAVRVLGVPAANVVIEDQSRTTVENIVNSALLMADSPAIKIASNTFHARRARQIMHDQSPDLARRLVRASDYLPVECGPLHAMMIVFQIYRSRRARTAAPA